tara:strand:- start:514 stop:822 length:309 start_codon:yes stop_codon:yes gene_type:complete
MNKSKQPIVQMSCAQKVGMSEETASNWDPGLWMYPLMSVHEEIGGDVDEEHSLTDGEGTYLFVNFDCGCMFYVPSSMIKGELSDDSLPGDVELNTPEKFSRN